MTEPLTTVVVPTLGRPSLRALLEALASGTRPMSAPLILVDDRPLVAGGGAEPGRNELARAEQGLDLPGLRVVRSGGGGPARARNIGWRHAATPWVSFLDDDVVPQPEWYERLLEELATLGDEVAGSQGRVRVPLPTHRRPTDWERGTAGLERATWITADMTYRRSALAAVGGFDERFPRAFREDADLGLRIVAQQGEIVRASRAVTHPVRPADDWVSVRQQAGNADDFLMRRLHGADWRERAGAPSGARTRHLAVAGAAVTAALSAAGGRRRTALLAALAWLGGTSHFAWRRIACGPRTADEVRRMVLTSAVIPLAAAWHSTRGAFQHRHAHPWRGVPELVLFDRDGTLVHDVPYNGDPGRVSPTRFARESLDRLRQVGVRVGVVTNQSGVGSGRITREAMQAVNDRVEQLLGPFDVWRVCPHQRDEGCTCRKPAPGMVKDACAELGVDPSRCVVVGDIATDVEAAEAAGAVGVLVPTPETRAEEVRAAERLADDLRAVVDDLLAGHW